MELQLFALIFYFTSEHIRINQAHEMTVFSNIPAEILRQVIRVVLQKFYFCWNITQRTFEGNVYRLTKYPVLSSNIKERCLLVTMSV